MKQVLPIDFARRYAQSDDFPHACQIHGIVPSDDPEVRIAQAQQLLREDSTLAELLSVENN